MSTLVHTVRSMFDLPMTEPHEPVRAHPPRVVPRPEQIVLVTGPSGSGKSQLLASIRRQHTESAWIDPTSVRLTDVSVIDTICRQIRPSCPEEAIESGLALLARVGLAEAWTYLRTPAELSDGQRWRLVLAMMVAVASRTPVNAIIAMDEFAALLDRVTAMIVARALRKLISAEANLSAIVVTSHDDLLPALRPDVCVECDFGDFRITQPPRV